ncbi:uncharacterized protein BDV17DRAFT_301863 [Aspergillus undulatus]|uniref:uncharacterized protein n=1 Tax=Aspergillus undulatus TaxID=1810928 RepID=UPI003CCE4895
MAWRRLFSGRADSNSNPNIVRPDPQPPHTAGKLIHVAGHPGSTKNGVVPPDYKSQIHLALLNLCKLVIASGFFIKHIVKLNLLIPSLPPVLSKLNGTIDVIVVGAGLSGLSPAHDLVLVGLPCIVLEGARPVKVYTLAKHYGVDLIEKNTQGNAVLQGFDGTCSPFAYGELSNFDKATQANLAEIHDMCEAHCHALDTWRPRDPSLDAETFEAYLRSRGASEAALATATGWTRAMLGQDPRDISALYFLDYCKSGGGFIADAISGQYLRARQGTQAFSLGLASSLPEGTIRLSSPVEPLIQSPSQSVKVQAGGAVYAARKAIITVPSLAMKTITFYPKLPPAMQAWIDSTKAMMEFRSPFWVEKGFALQQLGKLFNTSDIESQFVQMTTYEWVNDEWAGWGCPCTALSPDVLDTLCPDAVTESSRNLHFAGMETAGEWKGYIEGAIRSGERAAAEVIKSVNGGISLHL